MATDKTLTPLQDRFCEQYIIDDNGTYAAIRAGAKPKNAAITASKWLTMPKIRAKINELRAAASTHTGVSIERTLRVLGGIANVDPAEMYNSNGELMPIAEMPAHVRRAIEEITIEEIKVNGMVLGHVKKVKLSPRTKATDQIMKHLGGYEKDNRQKANNMTVIVDISDDDEPEIPIPDADSSEPEADD